MSEKIKDLSLVLCLSTLTAYVFATTSLEIKTISQAGYTGKFNLSNTERPGMMIEIMRAIEHIDPMVKFSGLDRQATVARAEIELESGAIEVFFGMAKTEGRNERHVFIDRPLYQTQNQLAALTNDHARITSLDDVKVLGSDGIILINNDETNADFLKSIGGLALDTTATNTVLNLKKLVMKRGRFYFASTLSLAEEIRAQNLSHDVKILPVKFRQTDIFAVFSKLTPASTVNRVSTSLTTLEKSGELSRIRKKYMEMN